MEFKLDNLDENKLNYLKKMLLSVCQDYEPWADTMMLGGAGDPGVDKFPLDLEEVESITITKGSAGAPQ